MKDRKPNLGSLYDAGGVSFTRKDPAENEPWPSWSEHANRPWLFLRPVIPAASAEPIFFAKNAGEVERDLYRPDHA